MEGTDAKVGRMPSMQGINSAGRWSVYMNPLSTDATTAIVITDASKQLKTEDGPNKSANLHKCRVLVQNGSLTEIMHVPGMREKSRFFLLAITRTTSCNEQERAKQNNKTD
jgi:hypothetical protein